jgi:hypothetical protein
MDPLERDTFTWVGAPLFFVTLLYALTLCSVCVVRLPKKWEDGDNGGEEQDQQGAQGVLGS